MDDNNGAIIVLNEMPDSCLRCSFNYDEIQCAVCARSTILVPDDARPDWCPLRPMPEKELVWGDDSWGDDSWAIGWNDCLECIKEKEK